MEVDIPLRPQPTPNNVQFHRHDGHATHNWIKDLSNASAADAFVARVDELKRVRQYSYVSIDDRELVRAVVEDLRRNGVLKRLVHEYRRTLKSNDNVHVVVRLMDFVDVDWCNATQTFAVSIVSYTDGHQRSRGGDTVTVNLPMLGITSRPVNPWKPETWPPFIDWRHDAFNGDRKAANEALYDGVIEVLRRNVDPMSIDHIVKSVGQSLHIAVDQDDVFREAVRLALLKGKRRGECFNNRHGIYVYCGNRPAKRKEA